jgi:DUF971 family protein
MNHSESGHMITTTPPPVELRLFLSRGVLEIDFPDCEHYAFSAEYLRVESPAERKTTVDGGATKRIIPGRRHVRIVSVEPVGSDGIRIIFDDNHDSGIYGWQYLRELGITQAETWTIYTTELLYRGLSRDP